jgi:hypothetical protein
VVVRGRCDFLWELECKKFLAREFLEGYFRAKFR